MTIFSVLTLVGGLALFLYGMDLMGNGLTRLSGGRLEHMLEKLTSNRISAVFLGLAVTAVIQSSSATTVMVVGFVNSGIMKLSQAVGIIMGANVGTTVTSWLLSLTGIEGDSFFLTLLKPSSFAPVLAAIGICLLMFSKREKKKNVGSILVGFAILMSGMETMSGAVKPLADVPEFGQVFTMFSNPFLGMLVGALLTAVVQSSSASVGILQALCATGAVSFGTAIPIIMGQNIGTCVTALLSSISANKNAKRAAMIHLYFNLIGTLVFMIGFYSVNAVHPFSFLGRIATPAGIAILHSCFNIGATLLLFPFGNALVKLAQLTIRDSKEEQTKADLLSRLDERFLDQPGLAIEQAEYVMNRMAEETRDAMRLAMKLIDGYDEEKVARVEELENRVDQYEDMLGTYLVRVASKDLTEEYSEQASVYLHSIGDFERISDHAVNLTQAFTEMQEKHLAFSGEAMEELRVYFAAVSEVLDMTTDSFVKQDQVLASQVEPLEQVIDALKREEKQRHIDRLAEGTCTIELGFILSDISTYLERASDHCSNIAVALIQKNVGGYEAHEYMTAVRNEENMAFRSEYQEMRDRYRLPERAAHVQKSSRA